MKSHKKSRLGPFSKLNKAQRTLIRLDFEGNHKNSEIAYQIGVKNSTTVSHWRARDWYQPAMEDYMKMQVNTTYQVKAVQTCYKLLKAKSEMVRLQAATSLLKMAGLFSDNSTPELDKAKLRKLNADADVSEAKARQLNEGTSLDGVTIQFVRSDREEEKDSENDQS